MKTSKKGTTNAPFVIERTYHATVQRVWEALTVREKMKEWYFDLSAFEATPGFEFQFYGQGTDGEQFLHLCKITEVIPLKKLAYTWSYAGLAGTTLVTFELFAEGNQTRLRLTHEGIETLEGNGPSFARSSFEMGWTELIGRLLKSYVEKE